MMKYFSTIGYIFVPNGWMTPDPTTKEWRLMWYSNRGWLDQNIVTPNNPHQHSKCWVALLSMKHVLMYVPNIYLLSHQPSHHAWYPWQLKQIEREWQWNDIYIYIYMRNRIAFDFYTNWLIDWLNWLNSSRSEYENNRKKIHPLYVSISHSFML